MHVEHRDSWRDCDGHCVHVLLGTLIGALWVGLVSGHALWIILMESLDMGRPAHCILTSFPGLVFWTVYSEDVR